VKLLLDTHVVLWSATAPDRLSAAARACIEDGENDVYVSAVVAWEIAIKQAIGKLDLPQPAEAWLPRVIDKSGFESLDVSVEAALRVRALPWHHRDPFDRLLVAQALATGCTLITQDDALTAYGVPLIRA
jgi:PIN domain nuclease of toxin-antitoxin system